MYYRFLFIYLFKLNTYTIMITDELLEELKLKNIEDLELTEKFNIIQSVYNGESLDYKSRWWLDVIFDESLSTHCDIEIYSSKLHCVVYIYADNETFTYKSRAKSSKRHDAMLNALTIYCQKC